MDIRAVVGQRAEVELGAHQLGFLQRVGVGQLQVVEELLAGLLRVVGELGLLQPQVSAPDSRVLAGQ